MNNTVIRGKSGWCSLIWSCSIFMPCHLLYNFPPNAFTLHFLFSPEKCHHMEKHQPAHSGRAEAGYSPHFLVTIYTVLCTFGVFLTQAMRKDRSGSLQCSQYLTFRLSHSLRGGVLGTGRERHTEMNLYHGWNCPSISPLQGLSNQSQRMMTERENWLYKRRPQLTSGGK